jgi:alkylhydroperoxidase family enzyme
MSFDHSPRIAPLSPPYDPEIAAALERWMPPGSDRPPLKLFRTLYQNPEISNRMRPLGAGILGPSSLLDPREREILIDRTCARCGCEYEWGVHVAAYGSLVGLSQEQLEETTGGAVKDERWSEQERLLIRAVDELHETFTLSDELWPQLATTWSTSQILEVIIAVGWYHLICFVANAARVEAEPWAARFPREG